MVKHRFGSIEELKKLLKQVKVIIVSNCIKEMRSEYSINFILCKISWIGQVLIGYNFASNLLNKPNSL